MGVRKKITFLDATPDAEHYVTGAVLDSVDTDIILNKRAKEVANWLAKPRRDDVFRRQRQHLFTSLKK